MSDSLRDTAPSSRMRVAFLISGNGSNLQAILDAIGRHEIDAQAIGVLSNRPNAYGLQRAAAAGIPHAAIDHRNYPDRPAFDAALDQQLRQWAPDLVVLAGFMRILGTGFVEAWLGRLVNIHPSLLPEFPGLHTHARALEAGHSEHGASVHFVTPELDGGPVIARARIRVRPDDTPDSLAQRVLRAEHRLYPAVLSALCSRRVHFADGKVISCEVPQQIPETFEFDDP